MEYSNRGSPPIAFIRVEYTISVSLKATVFQRVAKNPLNENQITMWFLGLPDRIIMHKMDSLVYSFHRSEGG